jgi:hypothetical protein
MYKINSDKLKEIKEERKSFRALSALRSQEGGYMDSLLKSGRNQFSAARLTE